MLSLMIPLIDRNLKYFLSHRLQISGYLTFTMATNTYKLFAAALCTRPQRS